MDFDEVRQRNEAKTEVAVNPEPAKLMPKVIMYDAVTGVPTNAQDVRVAQDQSINNAAVPRKNGSDDVLRKPCPKRRRTWRPS